MQDKPQRPFRELFQEFKEASPWLLGTLVAITLWLVFTMVALCLILKLLFT